MGPEDEEQQKQQEGFIKKSAKEFQRKKEKKEKAKKAVKIFMKLPTPIKIALLVILLVPIIILLFAAFRSAIDDIDFERVRTAKADLFGAGATSSDIVSLNKDNGTWDISLSEGLKQKLTDAGVNTEGMSQDELITELLKLYGFDENDFSDKELQLMPYLLKAEIATQYVDLRSRDQMYDSATKKYKTLSDSEIEEATKNNQILGTIHLKRVNTADLNNPIILEYVDYETVFKPIIDKQNPTEGDYNNIRNYFSINNEGNLVIATWSYNKVTYKLDDGFIENPYNGTNTFSDSESYTLSEMVVDYRPLVSKYTLPFEVLTALLINSEDVEFVEKVANLAFSANIEITIAEEMTETNKTYVTNYYETIRNYQYIRMCAPVNGNRTKIGEYEFLTGDSSCDTSSDVIDDLSGFSENNVNPPDSIYNCTYKDIYFTNNQPSYTVKQDIVLKDNTYKYGITYADTWFMKAEKTIDKKVTIENLEQSASRVEDTYKYSETKSSKRANIPKDIEKNYLEDYYNKNKQRIEEIARQKTEQQANSQVATQPHPEVLIEPSNIIINSTIKILHNQQINQIIDSNGTRLIGKSSKDPTTGLIVTTVSIGATNSLTLVDEGGNIYTYTKNANGVWEFEGTTSAIDVDYDQKTIRYKRTDTQSSIDSGSIKTKYELVEETPTQKLYDDKSEKFLKAYDESSTARGNMSSTPGWLEEMIDEYDPNFSTIIMYLLDSYYGRDTSEYDIDGIKGIYALGEFTSISSIKGSLIVKLDEPQALKELNKQQITDVINNYFTVTEAKNNLLSVVDDLVYIQDTYKVNAVFAMAIIKKESSGGTGWDLIDRETHNWASVKGSYSYDGKPYTDRKGTNWKKYASFNEATRDLGKLIGEDGPYFIEGNYTVEAIGNEYCQPPEAWIDTISSYIIGMYESIGESVYTFTSDGNDLQKKVAEVAINSIQYGISTEKGYCQGWVADVYAKAGVNGGQRVSAYTAVEAGREWGVSKDWNTIQLGATVYGYAYKYAGQYDSAGHVGIYIGNGQIAHNIGYVKIDDLQDWIKEYDGICWGWNGGNDLTGGAFPSKRRNDVKIEMGEI